MKSKIQLKLFICPLLTLVILLGCSPTHHIGKDGDNIFGGGFSDHKIAPDLYYLIAKANVSPWPSYSAAIKTWRYRADQLCDKNGYQELKMIMIEGRNPMYPPDDLRYNTWIGGYLLCSSSGITSNEAINYIDEIEKEKSNKLISYHSAQLDDLGGKNCNENNADTSSEILYNRGKILIASADYKAAMNCFLLVQNREQKIGSRLYKDSCSAIGNMYEMGWGVERNGSAAKMWYKKAGVILSK